MHTGFQFVKISLWNLLLKEMGKVNCFLLFIKPTIFALTWWSKSRWVSQILELFCSSVFGVVLVGLCCCKSTTWQHEMIRKNSRSFQFDTNITSAYQRTSRTIYKVFQLIWFCLMSSHHWVSVTFKKWQTETEFNILFQITLLGLEGPWYQANILMLMLLQAKSDDLAPKYTTWFFPRSRQFDVNHLTRELSP